MLLLWIEYVPHVFIGAAALIVLAVAADFAIAKVRGLSQRLRKTAPETEANTVEVVTHSGDNAPSVRVELQAASDDKMVATVEIQERMVRDTDRRLPLGAPTERHEVLAYGADTERCEPVAVSLEPVPDSSTFSNVDERHSDSASLVARAARELMQSRSARQVVEDAVVTRDPSVRIVDVAVAPSTRLAS
jgi:hypothetical protein